MKENELIDAINKRFVETENADNVLKNAIENIAAVLVRSGNLPEEEKEKLKQFKRIPAPTRSELIQKK